MPGQDCAIDRSAPVPEDVLGWTWYNPHPDQPMTSVRLAAYIGGGALLVAWFAAAASAPVQDAPPPRELRPAPTTGSSSIASEVQAQALLLRERLAQAPAPDLNHRNPFSFAAAPVARLTRPLAKGVVLEPPAPVVPEVPPLSLMGIAEETTLDGPRRTAVIGGAADALYMVTSGESFADRYQVTTIGADAIELKDLITGGYRRLALR